MPCLLRWLVVALTAVVPAVAAEADALAISRNLQARHFPHFGVLDPVFDSRYGMTIVSYSRCGDSALWTGSYLAAEAFRYKVTHSADALANAKRAFAGIQSLVDVTGNNVLARCLIPDDSPYASAIASEEANNGIYHSAPGNFWVGNTSRDEYTGVMFGLAAAYEFIDDAALKSSISDVVTRLVQFLKDHNWSVVLPDGTATTTFLIRPDQQLAFLQLARQVNPDQFSTAYDISRVLLSTTVIAPISVDVLSDDSYFKFNLDSMNLYLLIHLENSSFNDLYHNAYDVLRNHTDDQQNAFFNMIDFGVNGANATRDAESRTLLDQWLLRMRRDPYFDYHGKYATCGNPDVACQPLPIVDRAATDFIWQRSPFQLAGGADGLIETAGIDYILPYWMGRYYGVIAPDSVHVGSAASGTPLLAPESIASIYGSSLAVAAQSTPSQPPPASLAGVTVTVKDLSGTSLPALLYFVSAGQVNFMVPPGLIPGTGSVTVHSNSGTDLITSIELLKAAPSLFTADASGSGPPAALIGGSPVFSCSGSTCAPVPVDVSGPSAVYLSLYGTGIRNRSSLAGVTCTVGGIAVPVLYAGAQSEYAGLDQVNVQLTTALRGLGSVDLTLTVDGTVSNPVRLQLQ
ncbi:MAG: hypothetical protein ABI693_04110 [Bryobacteraceae bacterium]